MKTKNLVVIGFINTNELDSEDQSKISEVRDACTALESKYGSGRTMQGVVRYHKVVIDVGPLGIDPFAEVNYKAIPDCIPEQTKIALKQMDGQDDIGMYIYAHHYENGALARVLDPCVLSEVIKEMGFHDKTRPIRKMCLVSCRTFERLSEAMKGKGGGYLQAFHSFLGKSEIHTTLAGYSRPIFVSNNGSKLASPLNSGDGAFEGRTPVKDDKYAVSGELNSKKLREAIKIVWTWNESTQIPMKFPDAKYHDDTFG